MFLDTLNKTYRTEHYSEVGTFRNHHCNKFIKATDFKCSKNIKLFQNFIKNTRSKEEF